ncbi:MAG: asparagine synthase (glutamine-hydrolyzing) [Acidiferrobacteraceae bacterium]
MCGIAGFIKRDGEDAAACISRMTDALAHRGPDDSGAYITTASHGTLQVALGHRRLAIIDLVAGHQPIADESGHIQLVFNGEIYNYRELRRELKDRGHAFSTNSDTEVLLRAYQEFGPRCVERLCGMFAFAVWDARTETLILARDRFGKKPLFIAQSEGVIAFASEIKALLAYGHATHTVDTDAIWDYLAYRYVPAPATLFRGIRKVPPGSWLEWREGRTVEHRYYSPMDGQPRLVGPIPADPVGTFLARLDAAVERRMVSDVPFGAFLSGGIDSSAIVALMTRHSEIPISTFSVGFREARYSELAYARVVAQSFGTRHHELTISEEDVMTYLPEAIRYRDAPVSEPSDIPILLLSREAARSVKMILTGEGSDETLGGYPKHVFERYTALYQRIPQRVRDGVIVPMVRALPYPFRRIKTAVSNLGIHSWEDRMPCWFGALPPGERGRLARDLQPTRHSDSGKSGTAAPNSALRRILYFDQTSWLPDNLLERGDRMTMAASLEARMPFMDHELAEFVSSLPDRYRVRGMQTKWILRQAMRRVLPKTILNRPKVGFRVPVNEWFRGKMREYLCDHLTGPASQTRAYYQPNELERILNEHLSGHQNHEKLLWSLLNLELWHRIYAAPHSAPAV